MNLEFVFIEVVLGTILGEFGAEEAWLTVNFDLGCCELFLARTLLRPGDLFCLLIYAPAFGVAGALVNARGLTGMGEGGGVGKIGNL